MRVLKALWLVAFVALGACHAKKEAETSDAKWTLSPGYFGLMQHVHDPEIKICTDANDDHWSEVTMGVRESIHAWYRALEPIVRKPLTTNIRFEFNDENCHRGAALIVERYTDVAHGLTDMNNSQPTISFRNLNFIPYKLYLHEIGHAFGLFHSEQSQADTVMTEYLVTRSVLDIDDVQGIREIYRRVHGGRSEATEVGLTCQVGMHDHPWSGDSGEVCGLSEGGRVMHFFPPEHGQCKQAMIDDLSDDEAVCTSIEILQEGDERAGELLVVTEEDDCTTEQPAAFCFYGWDQGRCGFFRDVDDHFLNYEETEASECTLGRIQEMGEGTFGASLCPYLAPMAKAADYEELQGQFCRWDR